MNRVNFIKLFVAAPFGWKFAQMLRDRRQERRYLLNRFFVAGFKYYSGPDVIAALAEGEELRLKADPANQYDCFAVEIMRGESELGYVPQTDNRPVSRLLRQGLELTCRAEKINPEADTWKMLRVEVYI